MKPSPKNQGTFRENPDREQLLPKVGKHVHIGIPRLYFQLGDVGFPGRGLCKKLLGD